MSSLRETAPPIDRTSRTQGRRRLLKKGTDMERRRRFPKYRKHKWGGKDIALLKGVWGCSPGGGVLLFFLHT